MKGAAPDITSEFPNNLHGEMLIFSSTVTTGSKTKWAAGMPLVGVYVNCKAQACMDPTAGTEQAVRGENKNENENKSALSLH